MTPIQWQDAPERTEPPKRQNASAETHVLVQTKSDPWFAISVLLIGLIIGFWLGKSRGVNVPVARGNPPVQIAAPVPKAPVAAKTKTIKMTAELWKFTPNVVRVKKGEKVALAISGTSGTHGLSVPGLGINTTIIQGNTVNVAIPTDKTGTFDFSCSIQCGSGHSDMKGQIVIEA